MRRSLTVILLAAMLPVTLVGSEKPALPSGPELARRVRNTAPEQSSERTGTLCINRKLIVPLRVEVTAGGTTWKTVYRTAAANNIPANEAIVIHEIDKPNKYFYAVSTNSDSNLPTPMAISPATAAETPLANSDISLADLGLEFLDWQHEQQVTVERRFVFERCYVLQSTNPIPSQISRVKSWIDVNSEGMVAAEAYDAEGMPVKEFSLSGSNLKRVNGQWQLKKLTIRSPRKKSDTVIQFDITQH